MELSQRDLLNNYKCYAVDYRSIWNLTFARHCSGWNSGIHGWNFDAYIVGDVCITAGFRPIGKRIDAEYVAKFEKRAEALWERCIWPRDRVKAKQKIDDLFAEFIKGLEA